MALIVSTLVFGCTMGALVLQDTLNLGQSVDPILGDIDATWVVRLTEALEAMNRVSLGVLCWTAVDKIQWRWLHIRETVLGANGWRDANPSIRAAVILGWFIGFAAVMIAVGR